MRLAALELGKTGLTLSVARARQVVSNIYKLYGYSCTKLYELGVTSDPGFCDVTDIRKFMRANYSSEFAYFYNVAASRYDFSSKRIKFVLQYYKDLQSKEILYHAGSLMHCIESLETIDVLIRNNAITNKNKQIKPKITIGGNIACSGKLPLDDAIVLNLFERTAGSRLVEIDTRDIFVKHLCRFAEIDETIFEKYKSENKSLFIKGLTFTEELDYLKEIVNLEIELLGDYGKVLTAKINKYNAENFNNKSFIYTVLYNVNLSSIDERCKVTEEVRKSYGLGFIRNFYVNFDKTYIEINSTGEDIQKIYSYNHYGNYIVDYLTGDSLHPYNLLEGYNGEFISEADVKKYGYKTFGLPVPLVKSVEDEKVVTENYYPAFVVTDVKDGVDCFKNNMQFMLHSGVVYTFDSVHKEDASVKMAEQFKRFCGADDNIFKSISKIDTWFKPYCSMKNLDGLLSFAVKDMLILFIFLGTDRIKTLSSDFFFSLIQENNYYTKGLLYLNDFLKSSSW